MNEEMMITEKQNEELSRVLGNHPTIPHQNVLNISLNFVLMYHYGCITSPIIHSNVTDPQNRTMSSSTLQPDISEMNSNTVIVYTCAW